ncbi:TVP38/TMEM64 family protein [Solibacillus sp. FSL H8-0538]|uniref:TVP38/TMEM64 family protein n=1 Tax=Solibacillus sp. FSL H8-0538 TaxID=2921400 RepID=UPI0030F5C5CE
MLDWLTFDNIENITEQYKLLGPIMGVLLTFFEAFMPFLPLVVIVVANASAYGLFWGFILSWLGTVLGSYAVFLLLRRFGHHKRANFLTQRVQVQKLIKWVDMRGIAPLFALLCFPFTPIVIVNIVAGLSNIKKQYYFLTLFIAKPVMIFSMSYLGSDLRSILSSPVKLIFAVVVLIIVWFAGKAFENHLNKRVERDLRKIEQRKRDSL